MPWRFQRRISIFPGVRINIGKGGISTSVGPKGADINIGKHGVTTNAGIPGTGLSYRQRVGKPGTWLGVGLFVVALALGAYRYSDKIWTFFNHPPAVTTADHTAPPPHRTARSGTAADAVIAAAEPASGLRYVRRGNSVLRGKPSASSPAIAHEVKGAKVTLLAVAGVWCKVNDGTQEGWMRTSVLGETPPKTD